MTDYPRDMRGYGAHPPAANWPNGARTAVQFVINYEEGGENCVLHGDAQSEAFLSEIVGAQPIPEQRHMNMESLYEYGSRAGFWRLHRLFTSRGVPVTVLQVPGSFPVTRPPRPVNEPVSSPPRGLEDPTVLRGAAGAFVAQTSRYCSLPTYSLPVIR